MLIKPNKRICLSGIAAICSKVRLNTVGLRNGMTPSIMSINAVATHRLTIWIGFVESEIQY